MFNIRMDSVDFLAKGDICLDKKKKKILKNRSKYKGDISE